MSSEERENLGIDTFDVILISGDAYLDHPASATALLGRTLWDAGFSVGVISQPDVSDQSSFKVLGSPNLFFSVSGGSMDSMVAHLTPAKKRRSEDAFSPGGELMRPDRATLVYSDLIHKTYKNTPIIIGGIEASLRRFAHYDYWSDRIRQSILADAPAAMLVYGMGEKQLVTLATRASAGEELTAIHDVRGTCWKIAPKEWAKAETEGKIPPVVQIPSYAEVSENPVRFASSHSLIAREQNPFSGSPILQRHPKTIIIQNPPAYPLTSAEIDAIYDLPYTRQAHPSYGKPIPALEPIKFSVTSHRGCYGNCSFCALAMHQGRIIQSRSQESIIREAEAIASMPDFKGTITDIGGPSVNMYKDSCPVWEKSGPCSDRECPSCKNRKSGILEYLNLLDAVESVPGIKHVFIGSGLRYDLVPADREIIEQICSHVSGQLKVAPEHVSPVVTSIMKKPDVCVFDSFREIFEDIQKDKKKKQYIIPYLMSGHPGCTLSDMIALALYLKAHHLYTEQVQDFTPTPMTASTCMYATGINPETMLPVYVPKEQEKVIQRSLLQWQDDERYEQVRAGLVCAGRTDLIGDDPACLISKRKPYTNYRKKEMSRKSQGNRR
jgi:uncharacterized radical SAM protein YgiQ